ncbi:MAG: beta-ketoacyl synthase N-terminal-like domain-containing protein, partial [Chloroflexota bacterium]
MPARRVVITGLGALTAAADDVRGTAAALAAGSRWPSRITAFDLRTLALDWHLRRYLSRAAGLAAAAALQALASGAVERQPGAGPPRGAVLAVVRPGARDADLTGAPTADDRPVALAPLDVIRGEAATATAVVAHLAGCEGPLATLGGSLSASLEAVGEAFHWIRAGAAAMVVAGGSTAFEGPPLPEAGGWAEAAALLLLEDRESALARRAPLLAEVLDFASAGPGAPALL